MKRILVVLSAAMITAALFVLSACAGSGAPGAESEDNTAKFVGDWVLASMEGEGVDDATLAMMREQGFEYVITLNDDGTLDADAFGTQATGTWEATSATEASLTIDGAVGTVALDGETLTMEQDGTKFVFERRSEQPEKTAEQAADQAPAESSEQNLEEHAGEPAEQAADQPAEESAETPAEEYVEAPAEEYVDQPAQADAGESSEAYEGEQAAA